MNLKENRPEHSDVLFILNNNKSGVFLSDVNIEVYSRRIIDYADFVSIYIESQLAGFIAYYLNGDASYISMLIVDKKHQGIGLSNLLLDKYLFSMRERNIKLIELEVRLCNFRAIAIYENNDFFIYKVDGDKMKMRKVL
ncbi:GNAT family N-acetyltransferase [Edwardsiella tarda]|uniref:GNAT family N-acetyltransferase n=1 Tax=Edwardsiella tarda TaxID=636 RepID=UPI00351C46A4